MKRILLLSAAMLLLYGCTDTPPDEPPAPQSSEAETEVIYDQLYCKSLTDYTFLAFRTPETPDSGYAWLTADKWVPVWNFEPETDYPDGTFVKITADVTILSGGESGYSNEPQIDNLKNVQPVSYAEALPQCDIPAEDTQYNQIARKFETNESYYFIYNDETVYRDGEKLGSFPDSDPFTHETLRPYYECPFLLDYITQDTLLSVEQHADVIIGGTAYTPYDALAVDHAIFEIFEQPDDYIIDTNAMIFTAAQIAEARESGVYVMLTIPEYSCVQIGDESIQYCWASVCSETADGDLTVNLDGLHSVLVKNEAKEKFLQVCEPAVSVSDTET